MLNENIIKPYNPSFKIFILPIAVMLLISFDLNGYNGGIVGLLMFVLLVFVLAYLFISRKKFELSFGETSFSVTYLERFQSRVVEIPYNRIRDIIIDNDRFLGGKDARNIYISIIKTDQSADDVQRLKNTVDRSNNPLINFKEMFNPGYTQFADIDVININLISQKYVELIASEISKRTVNLNIKYKEIGTFQRPF